MKISQIFNEEIELGSWILSFKNYRWILPLEVRSNELLCNQIFDLSQVIFAPCSNLLTDAIMPSEKSQLLTSIFYDRMIREELIKPAHNYKLNSINNIIELCGIYHPPICKESSVLVKVIHFQREASIGLSLRSPTDHNLSGFEVFAQFHHDCIASINCMRLLISFLKKIQKEYL